MALNPSTEPVRPRTTRALATVLHWLVPAASLLLLGSTLGTNAELVVFTTGDVLKVAGFQIDHSDVFLQLAAGGRLRMPLSKIERILDDEIVEVEQPPEPEPAPGFDLAFDDSHGVPSAPYGSLIHEAARRQRLNPELVAAMVQCESAFDPGATSPRGAQGLMQLMPATAERFGVDPTELHDPARNLEAGTKYLRWLADRFDGELPLVLAAFNSGEGTVDRFRGVPPYRETREYLRRVYRRLGLHSAL